MSVSDVAVTTILSVFSHTGRQTQRQNCAMKSIISKKILENVAAMSLLPLADDRQMIISADFVGQFYWTTKKSAYFSMTHHR